MDAATDTPIVGALVTCTHSSYTSPAPCAGNAVTNDQGSYIFENVFFHDTDAVNLTVQATGYQPQEFGQTFFTFNGLEKDFTLRHAP